MRDFLQRIKGASTLIFLVLILMIILQNTHPVQTRILFFSVVMPVALLLFGALAAGFALGAAWTGKRIAFKK
jgi:uncharacterized integral membrane protein